MKKSLMDILVCPVCKGKLDLTVEKEEGGEIVTGTLYCGRCNVRYPIQDTIPNLLPPSVGGASPGTGREKPGQKAPRS
jgi:uncharacterized protein YbaR (Trm112 family)